MKHLLVTNDFPPKVGGIQSYLWELWRRLPADEFSVLATRYEGDKAWDDQQPFEVRRTKQWWLLPTRKLVAEINATAKATGAELVVLDPVVPLGLVGPRLDLPYVAIAHGAEYVIPARLRPSRPFVARVTRNASGIVASGDYVASAVRKMLASANVPVVSIPPGVDSDRFHPLADDERREVRERFGVPQNAQLIVGVSRLVPRKGFDRLIEAAAMLRGTHPALQVLIAGKGREQKDLERLIEKHDAPVRLLGRVPDADLPSLYGAADAFCMPCHDRWFGLEAEGFGIVFCEASATGTPPIAGLSGGSGEAVIHGRTGLVVDAPVTARSVADAIASMFGDEPRRLSMGTAGRERSATDYSYDQLARRLHGFLGTIRPQKE